jgi:hypothetical protein
MTDLRPGMKIEITTSYAPDRARSDALSQVDAALTQLRDKLAGVTSQLSQVTMQEWADTLDGKVRTARPDNRMYQAGETPCHESDGVVRCLARQGHAGDHIGYGSTRRWHNDDVTCRAPGPCTCGYCPGGMHGWFISYPDKPIGATALCAACALIPDAVAKMLDKTRVYTAWPTGGQSWDGITSLRRIDSACHTPGWRPAKDWTCVHCRKKGWPGT